MFRCTLILLLFGLSVSTPSFAKSYIYNEARNPNQMDTNLKSRENRKEIIRLEELKTNNIIEESSEEEYDLKKDEIKSKVPSYPPIVYWHGMGDNAWNVKRALGFIEKELPGVYVKSLQIGSNLAKDMESGYFLNVNDQVKMVCEMIRNDSNLQGGYNAIGLSQGGQFLRAVAQRCPDPPVLNLISLGGQHQGVFGLPKCQAPKQEWCEIIDKLLTHVAYADWVQKFLVQAEYWHDPFQSEKYVQNSVFLADINNERVRNTTYRDNLLKLKNFILVLFEDETIVQPKESEWFGYYEDGQDKKMITLQDSALYKEDWLGLKAMNEAGRLHFLSSPGDHLQFSKEWFMENILTPFLRG